MLQDVSERGALHLLGEPTSKWSSRRRENDASHFDSWPTSYTLENSTVLSVDRHELATAAGASRPNEMTRHNEGLLVRERDSLAPLECGKSGIEAGSADDGIDDNVDVIPRRRSDQTIAPALPRRVVTRAIVDDADEGRMKLGFLLAQ